jgi:hypothetical protein
MRQDGITAVPSETPRKLDEVDRLTAENKYLRQLNFASRVEKIDLQMAALQKEKAEIVAAMKVTQEELKQFQVAMGEKYGVPIGPTTVNPDGTIRPEAPAGPVQLPGPGTVSPVTRMGDTIRAMPLEEPRVPDGFAGDVDAVRTITAG